MAFSRRLVSSQTNSLRSSPGANYNHPMIKGRQRGKEELVCLCSGAPVPLTASLNCLRLLSLVLLAKTRAEAASSASSTLEGAPSAP